MAFYQKYRAKTFKEMVGQTHVVATLLASIKNNRLVHAYLLTGPRGIGKTSTARLLAKAINCETSLKAKASGADFDGEPCNECQSCQEIAKGQAVDVVEIDAASHTGVEDVRDLIDKARLAPTRLSKKVYIIDEVHMLSKSAFNALLKTLEEPPAHVTFIMATTETHKIPATILSRAQRYDFRRAEKAELIENLRRVAAAEGIEIDDESLDLIATAAAGGHRDALSLLEQVASNKNKVTIDMTRQLLGIAETMFTMKFVGAIFDNFPEEGLKIAHELYDKGFDMAEFNKGVIELLRRILVYKVTNESFFEDTRENLAQIANLSAKKNQQEIVTFINIFIEAGTLLKDVSYPLLPMEMAVVKASQPVSKSADQPVSKSASQPVSRSASQPVSESANQLVSKSASRPVSRSVNQPVSESKEKEAKIEQSSNQNNSNVAIDKSENRPTTPVPVLEMTRDIWEQIITLTKEDNSTLAALLRDAKPLGLTDKSLILGVKFKFHKEKISEPKHIAYLEKKVCDVTGCNYQIVCRIEDGKPKPVKDADSSELEKAVGEVFDI